MKTVWYSPLHDEIFLWSCFNDGANRSVWAWTLGDSEENVENYGPSSYGMILLGAFE